MVSRVVESMEEFKRYALRYGGADFFILLAGGVCRSSKHVSYDDDDDVFFVLNEIDGSEQVLSEAELFTESNIGEALLKRALFVEVCDG